MKMGPEFQLVNALRHGYVENMRKANFTSLNYKRIHYKTTWHQVQPHCSICLWHRLSLRTQFYNQSTQSHTLTIRRQKQGLKKMPTKTRQPNRTVQPQSLSPISYKSEQKENDLKI